MSANARTSMFYGWRVVFACFWLAVFAWGIGFYGHGVYLAELTAHRGWSTSLLSLATTSYYLVGAVLMMFVGAVVERFGSRAVVLVSAVALCLALALLPFISAAWQIFPVYLVMAAGWAGTSWTAIPIILARWFDRRRGLAISIAFTGASAGGMIVPPLLLGLSARFGFATASDAVAALAVLVLVPLAAVVLHRGPEVLGSSPDGEAKPPAAHLPSSPEGTAADAPRHLRSFRFWTTALAFALALTSQVGFLTHEIPLLTPALGASVGLAVAATTAASIAGRFGLGFMLDRLEPRAISAAAFVLQAGAVAILGRSGLPWLLFAACVLYGVWVGNIITFPTLIIQREFPAHAFGTITGLVTAISQFTFAFGPGVLGVVRDGSGGYGPVLAICAILDLLAAALVVLPRIVRGPVGPAPRALDMRTCRARPTC